MISQGLEYESVRARMDERLRDAGNARRAADARAVRRAVETLERGVGAAILRLAPARPTAVELELDETEVA